MMNTLKAPDTTPPNLPWRRAASSIAATLGVLLLPKCPLCVAAYLVSLGLGAQAAHSAAPLLRPLAWLLMLAALAALAAGLWRLRPRRAAATPRGCCKISV